jgi:hypothetical protein
VKNLEHDFSPLAFNNAVGLTHHVDMGSRHRANMVLRLKPGVVRWCEATLSQPPMLKSYRATIINGRRTPGKVWLRFADDTDRTLFEIRFAHHFWPAAMSHMPFGTEWD